MWPGLWVEFEFVPLFAERGFSLGVPGVFFLSWTRKTRGGSRGGGPGPHLFLDQTKAQRAKKFWGETTPPPPLISRSGSSTQNTRPNSSLSRSTLSFLIKFLRTPKCFKGKQVLVFFSHFSAEHVRGCLHEKTRTSVSFTLGWLFDFVSPLRDDSGHFISCYLKVHFMLIKYMCGSKSQTICMHYPFQSTGRPISHWNRWSFHVYMIPLWDFVLEWNSRPGTRTGVNSRKGDSCRHNILWWYHVNKYRAMRGNRSELALGQKSPQCHVNNP